MNANENLKKRKYAIAVVKLGVASMLISVVWFLIALFYFHDIAIYDITPPLTVGTLIFVPSLVVVFIGLIKKQ